MKINLGIIIDTALKIPPNTGVTYRLYFLSKKMIEKGISVKIFLCNRNIENDNNLKLLFDSSFIEYHLIPEKIFYDKEKLKNIVNKSFPNINILQFEDDVSVLRFENIAKELKCPICLEMHDIEATLKKFLGYNLKNIKKTNIISKNACIIANKIICMTPVDLKELTNKINVKKEKIKLIPNPIDLNDFPYYGPNFSSLNLLFIGNMFYLPNQNAAKIIIKKIYNKLKENKKIKFYFVGMVPNEFKKQLIAPNIIFTGSVKNINKYLKLSTIALCPVAEGSGMKVKLLNYCAAGLPIITTEIGASGYEKINSLIIENNIDKYAEIILKLFQNPKKLEKIAKKNRKAIEKNFDINKIAQKMINTYKEMLRYKENNNKSYLDNKIPFPLWLTEKRTTKIKNKNYYIIKNGKIIHKRKII